MKYRVISILCLYSLLADTFAALLILHGSLLDIPSPGMLEVSGSSYAPYRKTPAALWGSCPAAE